MLQLTRQPQQRQVSKKASRFIRNTGVITKVLTRGYLPIRHDSLPTPFVSFEVETEAGKRYVVQVRGMQAAKLTVEAGLQVNYDGRYIFPVAGEKGGFFLASFCETSVNRDLAAYVAGLQAVKAQQEQQ